MTVMTVKGKGYFCYWNLTLKKSIFVEKLNSANQKTFFSRKSNFANYRKWNFSREFNFANSENSNFSLEFNFANLRLIRETREIFFPRKFLPLRYLLYLWPCLHLALFILHLCDLFFIFIFIMINRLLFCLFFRICPIIFGWKRGWRMWIILK